MVMLELESLVVTPFETNPLQITTSTEHQTENILMMNLPSYNTNFLISQLFLQITDNVFHKYANSLMKY